MVRDKEKRGEKERKRKKGEKEREKRKLGEHVWGAGWAHYAFLVRIYIKSGEIEKEGKDKEKIEVKSGCRRGKGEGILLPFG